MRQHVDPGHAAASDGGVLRPAPTPGWTDRTREWLAWFGVARLVTSAIAVTVVCVGAWFLVRTPTPPPESALPVATRTHALPVVTLPTPASTAVVAPAAAVVVVHVAGAVTSPGVFELRTGDRVADAIALAGGVTDAAEQGRINLAAPLVDGSRVYVPVTGEHVPPEPGAGFSVPGPDTVLVGPVNVNTADVSALDALPGVGPATAAAIVAERDRNGPFVSVSDLERVAGIGPSKLAALDGLVVT